MVQSVNMVMKVILFVALLVEIGRSTLIKSKEDLPLQEQIGLTMDEWPLRPAFMKGASLDKSKDDAMGLIRELTSRFYRHDAKSNWPYSLVKSKHHYQSPVDLVTSTAVTRNLPVLDIVEEHLKGVPATFYNSGHTVYINIDQEIEHRPYLSGGPLKENYILEQAHFHWGTEDDWGSEHFINGESASIEIHMVHFNSKYGTFDEAADKDDGLAVLTIFAEATDKHSNLVDPLYKLLPQVTEAGSKVQIDTRDALKWVASSFSVNDHYYTYPGSLTTEPYTENVIWILLTEPITLSHKQLAAFRSIKDKEHSCILDNKRHLQPLHNRPIIRANKLKP